MAEEVARAKEGRQEACVPVGGGAVIGARMGAEDRRRQLVQTAVKLFSQRGFRGTTTKEIAQAAGVSEAIIFRHFATKEDLYAAILDHKACAIGPVEWDAVFREAAEGKDDRAFFERLARHMLERHAEDVDFLRLLLYSALEGHQLAEMFWDRTAKPHDEIVIGYLRQRQRDGALRALDPQIIVRAFIGMLVHHSLCNTLWHKSCRPLDLSIQRAAQVFTEILLSGISDGNSHQAVAKTPSPRRKRLSKYVRQDKKKKSS